MTIPPFHLAIRVDDLVEAERFYAGVLGAGVGRRGDRWIDFDLCGHQVVAHLGQSRAPAPEASNPVDGDEVPVPHFGVVLSMDRWRSLGDRLAAKGVDFVIAPRTRFEGEPGEQGTFFLRDPAGNALEFKGFRDLGQLFAS
ncbi:MAG: VOC family protein [Planctomycetota bacterium]|nr:VOC family protein [Planctomycetota bacterium]